MSGSNDDSHYLKRELDELVQKDSSIFEFLQDGSLDGIWYWDLESPENEWMSPKFWQALGFDPSEKQHLVSEWQDLIFPEDLEAAVANFHAHCADSSHPYDQVVRYRHQDGSTVWIRCRGIAIRDSNGQPRRMLGAHNDLTVVKRAEIQQRQILESFSKHAPTAVVMLGSDLKFISWSREWIRTWQVDESDLQAKTFLDVFPQAADKWRPILDRCLAGATESNDRDKFDTADGRVEYVRWVVVPWNASDDEVGGVIMFTETITDQVVGAKKMREAEDRFKAFMDQSPLVAWIKDHEFVYRYINTQFEGMFGITKEKIVGTNDYDHFPAEYADQFRVNDLKVLEADDTLKSIEFTINPDGLRQEWLVHKFPVRTAEGNVWIGGTALDLTDRVAAERERRLSDFGLECAGVATFLCDLDGRLVRVNQGVCDLFGHAREELLKLTVYDLDGNLSKERSSGRLATLKTDRKLVYESVIRHEDGHETPVEFELNYFEFEGDQYIYGFVRDIAIRHQLELTQQVFNDELAKRAAEAEEQRLAAMKLARDAEAARKRAELAERRLAVTAARLALPPLEFNQSERRVQLDQFSLNDMMTCGGVIRGLSHEHLDEESYCAGVVDFLYNQFRLENDDSEFALVRIVRTQAYRDMTPEAQDVARSLLPSIEDSSLCQVVLASQGDAEDWSGVDQIGFYDIIPLECEAFLERVPITATVLDYLGMPIGPTVLNHQDILVKGTRIGTFLIPVAEGSPYITNQDELVGEYNVRSAVGFGDRLPDGSAFVVIGFTKTPVSEDAARMISHLAHSVRLGLLPFLSIEDKTLAQVQCVDLLLANHEHIVAEQESRLRETMKELANSNEALMHSNVELQQFAYVASHDLQSPLRGVSLFAQIIQKEYRDKLDERGAKFVDRMVDGTRRMHQLIQDLLAYSRVQSKADRFCQVDMNDVLSDAVSVQGNVEEGVQEWIASSALPVVYGDRVQLSQLFQNLLGNAIKYRSERTPEIRVSAERSGDDWIFSVHDNGIGIAGEHHEKIFEIFGRLHHRDEYPGTGIGLAICHRIVERHGGRIWVESEEGSGSTFHFTIRGTGPANREEDQ